MNEPLRGACKYFPFVYESGRISTCFFDTTCGLKRVGIFDAVCRECRRPIARQPEPMTEDMRKKTFPKDYE